MFEMKIMSVWVYIRKKISRNKPFIDQLSVTNLKVHLKDTNSCEELGKNKYEKTYYNKRLYLFN